MDPLYVGIIFIGAILIVISLLWILLDKKGSGDYSKKLDDKKQELENIIIDAEEMVEELNKFSDYIVTQMDLKNEELLLNFKNIDEKISKINSRISGHSLHKEKVKIKTDEETNIALGMEPKETKQSIVPKISHKNLPHNNLKEELSAEIDDKVINLRNKNKEILRLINKGMSDREIARRLNLGLGEIQLVMNLHRKVIGK